MAFRKIEKNVYNFEFKNSVRAKSNGSHVTFNFGRQLSNDLGLEHMVSVMVGDGVDKGRMAFSASTTADSDAYAVTFNNISVRRELLGLPLGTAKLTELPYEVVEGLLIVDLSPIEQALKAHVIKNAGPLLATSLANMAAA